jgi:hypothetical protein
VSEAKFEEITDEMCGKSVNRTALLRYMIPRWGMPAEKIHKDPTGFYCTPGAPNHLTIFIRHENSDRMIAQQGMFVVCRSPLADHAPIIEEALAPLQRGARVKLIIPTGLKLEFLHRLRYMNITADSLFPGIDGIGRSVAEFYRLFHIIWKPKEQLQGQQPIPNETTTPQVVIRNIDRADEMPDPTGMGGWVSEPPMETTESPPPEDQAGEG